MHKSFRTYQLALEFYELSKGLKLKNPMKDQFERAILSIVLNLSEGSAKPSAKERRRFYYTALGSCRETQTILFLNGDQKLYQISDKLAAHLHKLCKSL